MIGPNEDNARARDSENLTSLLRDNYLPSEWLEDSNFSQLFGGLNETVNYQKENVEGRDEEIIDLGVECPDRSSKIKYCEVDCMNSADDDSIHDSDEDNSTKWPIFNPKIVYDNFQVGMLFSCKEEFKEVVQSWSIQMGKTIKFVKNDKRRCKVICRRTNCPFVIYISQHEGSSSWQIRSYQEHSCTWNYHNKTLSSTLIAKKYVNKIRVNPKLKCNVFRREVIDDMKLHVSKDQAKKALKKARELVHMKEEEQFNKIWDYCLEIANTNVDSTIVVHTTEDPNLDGKKIFMRLYVCFSACKKGFLSGCRPIIGVDGCFLKGQHGGQLLTAVTLDGNNNIYPIAWAVVEAESRSSWEWFLNLLGGDLQIFENQQRYTFISDKQKGLIPAFENIFPEITNRFCVRHLHQNFKLAGFVGVALKNALWAAARATTLNQFTFRMKELEKIDGAAFKWLHEKPSSEWSRSHFNIISKCDTLLNNMCECFNAFILDARELPIISMLENIRTMVMKRILENKEKAMRWSGKLCPRVRDVLNKNIHEAATCIGFKSDEEHYKISTMHGAQYIVNLKCKSCSCRRWELTGIPCVHACAIIHMCMGDCEDYVESCYFVDTYKKIYECNIMPVNGEDEWPKSDKTPPLPPKYNKSKRGRPPKMRKRAFDEQPGHSQEKKLSRATVKLHCRKCKQSGHNSSTCGKKNPPTNETDLPHENAHLPMDNQSQLESISQSSTQQFTDKMIFVYSSRRKKTN